ncbi:MAG: hypothetical protein KAI67_01270 [Candidatus Pacebacteria bacterium]|nr:hypothetical protein [Candidatus Paceibacterota bacterium]
MKIQKIGILCVSLLVLTIFALPSVAQNASEEKDTGITLEKNQGEEQKIQNQVIEQTTSGQGPDIGNSENKGNVEDEDETEINGNQTKGEDGNSDSDNGQKVQNQINQNEDAQGEQNRSRVANAVQEMLGVADRNGEIGQQIRTVAQNQEQNQQEMEVELNKVKSRSGIVKLFIGPNYKELKNVENRLENHNKNLEDLKILRNQITDDVDKNIMDQQIQVMEQVQAELENEVNDEKKGVSLLGWLFKMFA